MESYIKIGRLVATHGVGGDLLIAHKLGNKNTFKGVKALFIEEVKDSLIPHFISSVSAKNDEESTIKLEGIDSKESAHRFIRKNVWMPEEDFIRIADKTAPIALLDYEIWNQNALLGRVEEVIEQPHQTILKSTHQGKELLIPLHAQTLEAIDRQKKKLYVQLPEGLLAIYLEK